MSFIMLMLFLLAVVGGCAILYFSYKMFRQGILDDETARRERLEQEATYAEKVEAKIPKTRTRASADKIKEFLERNQ